MPPPRLDSSVSSFRPVGQRIWPRGARSGRPHHRAATTSRLLAPPRSTTPPVVRALYPAGSELGGPGAGRRRQRHATALPRSAALPAPPLPCTRLDAGIDVAGSIFWSSAELGDARAPQLCATRQRRRGRDESWRGAVAARFPPLESPTQEAKRGLFPWQSPSS